ncbi:uncharacterized protein LOC121995128 [Zingiber officinale]|uniref:uncharacterized protein LOC121991281 n=1 Tax=Zingiber officinale TaxID=94328 RepID=UPI001C4A8533|nr:uncharacterized protein LOC121991281 [Zingiber officinale]XP_042404886.1 uncharacterized protein LOC121995128 [Zingiber officinale]
MEESRVVHQLLEVSSSSEGETDEEVAELELRPPTWLDYLADDGGGGGRGGVYAGKKKILSKQSSMRETRMEAKWEKRRKQVLQRKKSAGDTAAEVNEPVRNLTDEDMDELRGSIDLGFGFSEEGGGQDLCGTLPALNLYFAVNRQLSDPKLATPPSPGSTGTSSSSTLGGHLSPRSPANEHAAADDWKICNPGDNPQHVKTRLRHWAQAVAISLRQGC